jgi:hypothetical protein
MARTRKIAADKALLTALACGATVEQAARKAGLGERTVYRRLDDPEFLQRLRQGRQVGPSTGLGNGVGLPE